MATTQKVWRGARALRRFLVPIDELDPWPGNPRRGDVDGVRASLVRFGQTRPILLDASDGRRVVAGHHVAEAAREEGWTHVAAIPNEFETEEEARAYLLADNRTHDLGGYDDRLLVEQLSALASMEGTGYSDDDVSYLTAQLERAAAEMLPPDDPPEPERDRGASDLVEVVLYYAPAQRDQLEQWLRIIASEKGTDGASETVFEACREAAVALNQR